MEAQRAHIKQNAKRSCFRADRNLTIRFTVGRWPIEIRRFRFKIVGRSEPNDPFFPSLADRDSTIPFDKCWLIGIQRSLFYDR